MTSWQQIILKKFMTKLAPENINENQVTKKRVQKKINLESVNDEEKTDFYNLYRK